MESRELIIILFTFITFELLIISAFYCMGSGDGQVAESKHSDSKPVPAINPSTRTDAGAEPDLIFFFEDTPEDVRLTEHKIESYTDDEGYDIKNISSELNGDQLWVNMTMYGFVYDDEDIYYRMQAGDAEVFLYKGDGSVSYSDETVEYSVWTTINSISATINTNKLTSTTFRVSGRVVTEGTDDLYGEYTVFDDITGEPNGYELSYQDPKNDVVKEYYQSYLVHDKPEIDILSTRLVDHAETLIVTATLRGEVKSSQDIIYSIIIGNARFDYIAGKGTISYEGEFKKEVGVNITSKSISVDFIRKKLNFDSRYMQVSAGHEVSERKIYRDEQKIEIPIYLSCVGEDMDLQVTMFEDDQVIMSLQGDLNLTNSIELRYMIDQSGDNNGNVDTEELNIFIEQLRDNLSSDDFFEFYPLVDSISGQKSIDFMFENATGGINDWKSVSQSIIGRWKFPILSLNEHNVTFKFLNAQDQLGVMFDFAFDVAYERVIFKLSKELKYWELLPNTIFPKLYQKYITKNNDTILIPDLGYYVFKHRLEVSEFGFSIRYNETLAELDKEKPKDDSEAGFIPGFEVELIIVSVLVYIFYFIKIKNKH